MHIKSLTRSTTTTSALAFLLFTLFAIGALPQAHAFTAAADQKIRINWSGANVKSGTCTGTGARTDWGNSGGGGRTYPEYTFAQGTYTFTYGCYSADSSNHGGAWISTGATAKLYVNQASRNVDLQFSKSNKNPLAINPTVELYAPSNTYIPYRGTFTLSWEYTDPYGSCTANWGTPGVVLPVRGNVTLSNNGFSFYPIVRKHTITCSSPGIAPRASSEDITFAGEPEEVCGGYTGIICN